MAKMYDEILKKITENRTGVFAFVQPETPEFTASDFTPPPLTVVFVMTETLASGTPDET